MDMQGLTRQVRCVLLRSEPFPSILAAIVSASGAVVVKRYLPSSSSIWGGLLGEVFLIVGGYWVAIAKERWKQRRRLEEEAEELKQGISRFQRWLDKESDRYAHRRAAVTSSHGGRGMLASSTFILQQAWELVEYLRCVRDKWYDEVKDPSGRVVAIAGMGSLSDLDPSLAMAIAQVRDDQHQVRLDAHAKARKEAAKGAGGSKDLDTWFDAILERPASQGLLVGC